jgi:hypothetical protein
MSYIDNMLVSIFNVLLCNYFELDEGTLGCINLYIILSMFDEEKHDTDEYDNPLHALDI